MKDIVMDNSTTSSTPVDAGRRRLLRGVGVAVFGTTLGVGTGSGSDRAAGAADEGTRVDATEIEDWHDLDAIRDAHGDDYVLVNDLDRETAGYDEHVGDPDEGWEGVLLTGTFDGQGNEIRDLVIDRPDEARVGLFEGIGSATVSAVRVVDIAVTGGDWVGGLVGHNNGTVRNVSVSGTVNGEFRNMTGGLVGRNRGAVIQSSANAEVTGEVGVGGLVGWNRGGRIVESSASGEVTGEQVVGGLVGGIHNGRVVESSAIGDVTGEQNVGGLTGAIEMTGTVKSSAASGDVTGDEAIGGLAGKISSSAFDPSESVASSWASGSVSGDTDVGGLVGHNEGELVTECYWDTEASGQERAVGRTPENKTDVTGLTTDQMQGETAADTMTALDFEETWRLATAPPAYPALRALPAHAERASEEADDDGVPGFGIPGAVAGVACAIYGFKRFENGGFRSDSE